MDAEIGELGAVAMTRRFDEALVAIGRPRPILRSARDRVERGPRYDDAQPRSEVAAPAVFKDFRDPPVTAHEEPFAEGLRQVVEVDGGGSTSGDGTDVREEGLLERRERGCRARGACRREIEIGRLQRLEPNSARDARREMAEVRLLRELHGWPCATTVHERSREQRVDLGGGMTVGHFAEKADVFGIDHDCDSIIDVQYITTSPRMHEPGCLDDDAALAYVEGELDEAARTMTDAHLDRCAECRRLVSALARVSAFGAPRERPNVESSAEDAERRSDTGATALRRGQSVGRFVVIGLVGIGGMGAVYAAYDPQLDRKVAIKVLHPAIQARAAGQPDELLVEAQAMARLMHQNVVAVHDVGRFGPSIFIAMEFVEGKSLRLWLGEHHRTLKEILAVLIDSGRGLAAAHAAGIVHRDFKPDNVLVGKNGRAKVSDFGLARAMLSPEASTHTRREISGTPAYMSPEQQRGETLDARSDQYSFAMTLCEALGHESPAFAGTAMGPRPLRLPPPREDVPAPIRRVLERALATERSARFESMEALLEELVAAPRRRRRRVIGTLTMATTLTLLSILSYRAHVERSHVCASSEERVAVVWNASTKAAVRARFEGAGRVFARDAWKTIEPSLEAFARGLAEGDRAACEATRIRKEQSEEVLALRSSCFLRRREELRALVELLTIADDSAVENAVTAVGKLTPLNACKDDAALAMQPIPPTDPFVRAEVERLRARLSEVKVLLDSGEYRDGLSKATSCVAVAERLGYAPVIAESLYFDGALRDEVSDLKGAEASLYRAANEAERSRHDELAARARTLLVWVVGYRQARHEVGDVLANTARGAVLRVGGRADLAAPLENNMGTLLWAEGNYAAARERYDEAHDLWERAFGPEHPLVADALNNSAFVLWNEGKLERALTSHEQALAMRVRLLGPEHPEVAHSLNNIGLVAQDLGRFDDACKHHRRAIEIEAKTYGMEHARVANALNNLGLAELGLGENDASLASLERAYEIRKRTRDDSHPDIANSLVNIAMALLALQRTTAAVGTIEEAYARQTKHLGPGHPQLVETLLVQSAILRAANRPDEALARATDAERLAGAKLGREHPLIFAAYTAQGVSLLALRRPREALERLDPVLVHADTLADAFIVGEAAFAMARALENTGLRKEQIVGYLELARTRLRAAGPRAKQRLSELETFEGRR